MKVSFGVSLVSPSQSSSRSSNRSRCMPNPFVSAVRPACVFPACSNLHANGTEAGLASILPALPHAMTNYLTLASCGRSQQCRWRLRLPQSQFIMIMSVISSRIGCSWCFAAANYNCLTSLTRTLAMPATFRLIDAHASLPMCAMILLAIIFVVFVFAIGHLTVSF